VGGCGERKLCAGLLEVIKRKKGPHTYTHTQPRGIKSIKNWANGKEREKKRDTTIERLPAARK
jgi:hypothetical protein